MCMFVFLDLSVCISAYLYLFICSLYLLIVYLSVCVYVCLFVYLSVHLIVCVSVCLSVCLSVYLSVCLCICLHLFIRLSLLECLFSSLSSPTLLLNVSPRNQRLSEFNGSQCRCSERITSKSRKRKREREEAGSIDQIELCGRKEMTNGQGNCTIAS